MIPVILAGDCRETLRTLPDNSIDSVVTDPPYALVSVVQRFGADDAAPAKAGKTGVYQRASAGFMGQRWDTGETAFTVEFWSEVMRVLKPGGHVAAFGATRGYHRLACAIEDAGFEIRDSLSWLYGTGFPKSHDVSKGIDKAAGAEREVIGEHEAPGYAKLNVEHGAHNRTHTTFVKYSKEPATPAAREWQGWGTALKPAFEPIVLARKPLSEGTVAANVLRWGTGALNIDGCRVGGEPWKAHRATGLGSVKFFSEGDTPVIDKVPHDLGRWPANIVHDGSDEVVGAFPDAKGQLAKASSNPDSPRTRSVYGKLDRSDAPMEPRGDSGSAARFFYSAKASKADRAGSKHPTVKPIALMAWLCRLITPPGGTVLDPFAGSGTTGAAALQEGFRAILCEREVEYLADIRRRFDIIAAEDMLA